MQVVGYDEMGRPLVSSPSGLEELDYGEILRHRHLGIFGDAPQGHFLGGSYEITFGGDGGAIGARWKRLSARDRPREARLWQEAYREIGRICSWLGLPGYVRDEITRIYANLRNERLTQRTSLEKQLAKITWLACLIHRYPIPKAVVNKGLKELYGHGIGKISSKFIKAAAFRQIRFGVRQVKRQKYLYRYLGWNKSTRVGFEEIGTL
ncbi:MAG: hypothetical protein QXQ66_08495 [Candidatus Hadarchaeum sp.]|uniref:hypothetical protein n=1 Tax=Candidatus Hadarchaeum sp. TaxID=2883567 RepID=UPI00316F7AE3